MSERDLLIELLAWRLFEAGDPLTTWRRLGEEGRETWRQKVRRADQPRGLYPKDDQ
ncbi:MAG: hypothetical protein K0R61_11 [Microvirga sp.]|jgi:hypothetical protein|nr:hypothetical protein [Microvirga sp.]MDF2969561.1 hypothetical protein [Microvirga sp.]